MSERCPLGGIEFDQEIPKFCLEHCFALWEVARQTQAPEYEAFNDYGEDTDCQHAVSEFSSEALQPGNGAERYYSITHECGTCRTELGSETYRFNCPQASSTDS